MSKKQTILLLPHLRIHNANALSSPYTIGFPAMTAWLGFTHALQRKLNQYQGFETLHLMATAVVCHKIQLQTDQGGYDHALVLTRNPYTRNGEKAEASPIIYEARCHLEVSLVIEFEGIEHHLYVETDNELCQQVAKQLPLFKIASGDILPHVFTKHDKEQSNKQANDPSEALSLAFCRPKIEAIPIKDDDNDNKVYRKLIAKLMPGYVLIERRDLMSQAQAPNGQDSADALTTLLDYLNIHHNFDQGQKKWQSSRKEPGWIVPIATGFHGISDLQPSGQIKGSRDPRYPHRFAESIVTLGEFKMPYRIDSLDQMLWHYHYDPENKLYTCRQKPAIN